MWDKKRRTMIVIPNKGAAKMKAKAIEDTPKEVEGEVVVKEEKETGTEIGSKVLKIATQTMRMEPTKKKLLEDLMLTEYLPAIIKIEIKETMEELGGTMTTKKKEEREEAIEFAVIETTRMKVVITAKGRSAEKEDKIEANSMSEKISKLNPPPQQASHIPSNDLF